MSWVMGYGSDYRMVCAIIAVLMVFVGDCVYLNDIWKRKTAPHLYSWLIWTITQGTAAAAAWSGGGNFGAVCLAFGTLLQIIILYLTFRYGTRNITKSDTVLLIVALFAIVVWWQMGNALIAVLMITAIDAIGFVPTFRKTFAEPRSESVSFWAIMTVAAAFIIASSERYNFLTVFYVGIILAGNLTVWMICLLRRPVKAGGKVSCA